MPQKGYKQTEEHKRKIGLSNLGKGLGKNVSIKTRLLIRLSKLGEKNPSKRLDVRLKLSGQNCHLWKGGITPINQKIRHSSEYKIWRDKIFNRDNYTCVMCGLRNGNGKSIRLEADHLIPFSELVEQENIKTYEQAQKSITLWDILNGRTLCLLCHRKTNTYGRFIKGQNINHQIK